MPQDTQSRTTSETTQAHPDLLREITELLPAYVAYVDTDLRYVAANRMYIERFGRHTHQILGQLVAEVTGTAFENVAHHLRAALAGEPQYFEPHMTSIDGDRTLSVTHLPHRNPQGQVIGVIVYGYDITELRKTEAALLQSEKLAAVGRLASSIAHEINNPLEAVVNLLYLIETSVHHDAAQAHRYALQAQQELSRVTQITTSTLRFFRQSTARTSANIGDIADSVLALYAPRLTNFNIALTRQIDPHVTFSCFEGEIRQVLNNLVTNAIDAMRTGGGTLQVRVRPWQNGARVTIADSGQGMSPAIQARIFEAFYTTKGISGTGLGLWIAQELVTKHHGHLRLRSRETQGTVITLFLPQWDAGSP